MKLNVLLVKPYMHTDEIQPPLGLGYLAGTIRKEHNVEILDCIRLKFSIENFREFVKKKKYDVVGIQAYTFDLDKVDKYSKIVKELHPETRIFVGGPQPTLDSDATLKFLKYVDVGFDGEAEVGFPKFVELVKNKKDTELKELKEIPGLIYRNNGKIITNPRGLFKNLDELDPSWDLFNLEKYPLAPHGAFCKQYPIAPMILTRGCPYSCKFCGAPDISGKTPRSHSPEWAVNQIEHLTEKYGIKEIHIEDDNLTVSKNFTKEFCERLIERNLGITWTCPNGMRMDTLDDELVSLMKKSGLYSVSIAIESGSDDIREKMSKDLKTETIIEKVELLRKHDLEIIAFFIVGYPEETEEDIEDTIRFACSLDLKRATFSAFKPFPGTPVYDELVEKGEMKKIDDWSKFSLDKIAWTPKGISEKRLKNLRRKAFLKFYLRPKILTKMIGEIKNMENFIFISKRIVNWMS
jgi:anaerobic magnesium-protoporphyrin IX monomethyl ester cyclase